MKQRFMFLVCLIKYRLRLIGKKAVLLDTPEHDNLGDQAIAVAEEQFLRDNNISFFELTAGQIDGKEKWYAKFTPRRKVVLIQGGGFLGSLWPNEEYRVRRTIQAFSKNRVVIFPQTISFNDDDEFFRESHKVYNTHQNLTVFLRETRSLDFMKQYFSKVQCALVPDMVLYLNYRVMASQRKGVLLCMRDDKEKVLTSEMLDQLKDTLSIYSAEEIRCTDTLCGYPVGKTSRRREIMKKLQEFSKAQLVVTDRLHGMLLAVVSGTPCIAFQNVNGKVGGVYRWIEKLNYVYSVNSIDEFQDALSKLELDRAYSYDNKMFEDEFERIRIQICQK